MDVYNFITPLPKENERKNTASVHVKWRWRALTRFTCTRLKAAAVTKSPRTLQFPRRARDHHRIQILLVASFPETSYVVSFAAVTISFELMETMLLELRELKDDRFHALD